MSLPLPNLSLKLATLPIAVAVISALSACATTPMPSPEAKLAYEQTQKSLASQPVAIISDGCIVRIEMGKNDILYQQSDAAAVVMAQTVKNKLNTKGVKVDHITSPFVCATLSKDTLTKMDILVTADAKDQRNTAYPVLSTSNKFDGITNQAYLNLFSAVDKVNKLEDISKGIKTPLGLDNNSLNAIRQTEGTNKVFVVMLLANKPSFGASMTLGAATLFASGGTLVASMNKGQYYRLYLVDLETNQVEWYKQANVRGQVFKMPVSTSFNQPKLLKPLYND